MYAIRSYYVKATPNPFILKILKEEGCGTDCSSMTELQMSEAVGILGSEIMFSSNDTPEGEFKKANDLGAIINLDDITMIDFLKEECGIPETISCRRITSYNVCYTKLLRFSPYSDTNLRNCTLKEAMHSPLFQKLQQEDILLTDHLGGCVLYNQKELVEDLLKSRDRTRLDA